MIYYKFEYFNIPPSSKIQFPTPPVKFDESPGFTWVLGSRVRVPGPGPGSGSRVRVPGPGFNLHHRIKISNRRATQRCNVSAFFYAKLCSLLTRRRSSQPVQRVYWPENVIDWLGKWRPTCVMRHARGQKLQSFRRKWPFYMNLYSMIYI